MPDDVDITLDAETDPRTSQAKLLNDRAMALFNSGGNAKTCLSVLKRAIALVPDLAQAYSNLGMVQWHVGQVDDARESFLRSIELAPDNHVFHANMGVFAGANDSPDTASHYLQQALILDPGDLAARWDYCLLKLAQGEWDDGLPLYDVRRQHRGPKLFPGMPYPLWRGEPLDGKTIYVQGEQGVGDRILFTRYFAWMKQQWPTCHIVTCLNDKLTNLFWEYREIVEFKPEGIPWPIGIDYGAFLQTIPQFHHSRRDFVPPDPGYIKRRTELQNTCILPPPTLPSLRVAICWTGNPSQNRNHERSIPVEMFLPLGEDPRITLYSVQCSPGNQQLRAIGGTELIVDLSNNLEQAGWIGTAEALTCFDLTITVCTSIAHLCGVLELPCWTLLCKDPYWIWPRSGSATAWYPNMRLFHQTGSGDWQTVMDEVRGELGRLADSRIGPA